MTSKKTGAEAMKLKNCKTIRKPLARGLMMQRVALDN